MNSLKAVKRDCFLSENNLPWRSCTRERKEPLKLGRVTQNVIVSESVKTDNFEDFTENYRCTGNDRARLKFLHSESLFQLINGVKVVFQKVCPNCTLGRIYIFCHANYSCLKKWEDSNHGVHKFKFTFRIPKFTVNTIPLQILQSQILKFSSVIFAVRNLILFVWCLADILSTIKTENILTSNSGLISIVHVFSVNMAL